MATRAPLEQRLWSKVDIRGPNECWLWTGYVGPGGYGRYKVNGVTTQAHRIAFELANGHEPYPFALHRCDVRLCCNPAHLWEGDHKANVRDMVAKRRGQNQHTLGKHVPRTHCVHGHEYTPDNTAIWGGVRYCRTCAKVRDQQKHLRRKAESQSTTTSKERGRAVLS